MGIKELTLEKLNKYSEHLTSDLKLAPPSVKRKLISVKKFLKWAYDKGYIVKDINQTDIGSQPSQVPIDNGLDRLILPHEASNIDHNASIDIIYGDAGILKFIKNIFTNSPRTKVANLYRAYHSLPFTHYLHFSILIIFIAFIAIGLYNQLFKDVTTPLANPAGTTNVIPPRYLSFQGRLTDSSGNPITSPTNMRYLIYNDSAATGSAKLWEELRYVSPDSDGVINVLLGEAVVIPSTLFSENADLWLGVTVQRDAEATPRQRIATVAFAENAEFLQGHPPSASVSANQIPVMTQSGDFYIAQASPRIYSASGGFKIEGQTLTFETEAAGNISLAPDTTGQVLVTSQNITSNTFDVQNSAITTGNLIYGYTGNDNSGYNLLKLTSGSSETQKFLVDQSGNASASGDFTVGAIDTTPNISTVGMKTLTLGNSTTGAVVLAPGGTTALTAYSNDVTIADTLTVSGAFDANSTSTFGDIIALDGSNRILQSTSANMTLRTVTSGDLNLTSAGEINFDDTSTGSIPFALDDTTLNTPSVAIVDAINEAYAAATGGTGSFWQRNSAVLSPKNITDDLIIGSIATPSAATNDYFQVFGSASTAGDASSSGQLTLGTNRTAGIIETEKMLPLTIGSATTGSVQLSPKGTTGLFVNGAGRVGISTTTFSTNSVLEINGLAYYLGGSSGGARFTGDENTGFHNPAGDQIFFFANGQNALAVDGTSGQGELGVYVTPDAVLDAYAANSYGSNLFELERESGGVAGGQKYLTVSLNGLTKFTPYNTDATTPLEIEVASTGDASLQFDSDGNEFTIGIDSSDSDKFKISDNTGLGTNDRLTIDSTGNVGIGTTTPTALLDVAGDASTSGSLVFNGSNKSIDILNGSRLDFQVSPGGDVGLVQAVTIDNAGRVGIGTTGPLSKLDVNGGTAIGTYAGSTAAPANGLIVSGNVGIKTGTPTTFDLEVGGHIGPTIGSTYDLGSSSRRWNNIYGITANFTGFSTVTATISGTTTQDFLINSDNITADTEDASLSFSRGTDNTNPVLRWNSTTKQLSTNTPSFAILPDTTITFSGTAALIVDQIQSQDILTASASGITKFTVGSGGNLTLAGTISGATNETINGIDISAGAVSDITTLDVDSTSTFGDIIALDGSNRILQSTSANMTLRTVTSGDLNLTSAGEINFDDTSTGSIPFALDDTTLNTPSVAIVDAINEAYAAAISFWQRNTAVLSPKNITDDLIIGSIATPSAATNDYFQVFGSAATAGDASSSGQLTLGTNRTAGIIETEKMLPLTIGSATTGSVQLSPKGTTGLFVNGLGNVGIGTTAPTYKTDIVSSDTTGLLNLTGDSITAGTGINISMDALTSGTGMLMDLTPAGALTFSGDFLKLNIGANATVTGNILNVVDNGSSVFSLNQTAVTSRLPANFTAAGDVSIAYDLQFTNQTASYIKSYGPLTIESGETFENLDLTLDPSGTGNVVTLGNAQIFKADPSIIFNVTTGTDTDFWMGVQEDAGSDDDDKLMIGDGTTTGTNPFLTVDTSGDVGIGTTTPLFLLHTSANQAATVSAMIQNTDTGTNADGLAIKLGYTGSNNNNNAFISFLDGNGKVQGRIRGDGTNSVQYRTSGIDIAEYFTAEYPTSIYEEGDVISLDITNKTVSKSKTAYDEKTIGILSLHPAFAGGQEEGPNQILVGLIGQIPVKIASNSQTIQSGDPLAASSEEGKAMKATKAGAVIGKAMESWTPQSGKTKIMAYITTGWYDPSAKLNSNGILVNLTTNVLNATSAVILSIQSQIASITDLISTNITAVNINTQKLKINGINIDEYISNLIANLSTTYNLQPTTNLVSPIVETNEIGFKNNNLSFKNQDKETVFSIDENGNATAAGELTANSLNTNSLDARRLEAGEASISGTLYAQKIVADEVVTQKVTIVERIEEIVSRLVPPPPEVPQTISSTASASISYEELMGLLDEAKKEEQTPLDADSLSLSSNLYVYGQANLADAFVTGKIVQGVSLEITQGNTINVLNGTLYLQSFGQRVDLAGGSLTIDEMGNAYFAGNVTIAGDLAVNTIKPVSDNLLIDLSTSSGLSDLNSSNSGQTAFGKLLIKGNVYTEGDFNARSASVSGQLYADSLKLSSDLSASYSGVIIAAAQTASASGIFAPSIVTNATTGIGILPAGETQVVVFNDNVSNDKLIYLTPTSPTENKVVYVKAKKAGYQSAPGSAPGSAPDPGYFVVAVDSPIDNDITFNWWIIN